MADKDKKGGLLGILIPIILAVVALLVVFVLLVKLDVLGLGTKVLGPKLEKVPIINLILPEMPEEETLEPEVIGYQFETVDQAVERLKATEILLKEKEQEAEKLHEEILLLNDEIDRLKIFEANQVQFEESKNAFDQLVAQQVGPEAFMQYIEKIYPDKALEIYEMYVKEKVVTDQIKELSAMYQSMEPENAARILEQTAQVNQEMVKDILLNIDSIQAGEILAEMDPAIADRISRYIYPDNN